MRSTLFSLWLGSSILILLAASSAISGQPDQSSSSPSTAAISPVPEAKSSGSDAAPDGPDAAKHSDAPKPANSPKSPASTSFSATPSPPTPASSADSLPKDSTGPVPPITDPDTPGATANPIDSSAQTKIVEVPDEPGEIRMTKENPVLSTPIPMAPLLEVNAPKVYKSVLPKPADNANNLYEPKLFVKKFVFTGNHVFLSHTLANEVSKYTGRMITGEELEDARESITLFYVNHGYINSGAILPDQDPSSGIITVKVVEGKLSSVIVTGNHWFQSWWLRNEMRQSAGQPLNYPGLKSGMQVLRENPTISQVNAELQPGGAPGESQLKMEVKDTQPFRFGVEVNNYRPPSVGTAIAEAHFTDLNLTGNNDPLTLNYGIANETSNGYQFSNLENIGADYRFPLTPWRTTMEVGADRSNSGIAEAPFNQLNIQSKLIEYRATIHQPIIDTPLRTLTLSLSGDFRRSETTLLGEPFSLSTGAVNGVEQVFVPRFIQEFVDRSQAHVFSIRSQFSLGIDEFHATINSAAPDAKFFDWLGQMQYIRRICATDNLVVLRLSSQLSNRPLLSLEQLQLGGISSVRGYLENQDLRDDGVLATAELHFPICEDKDHNSQLTIAPFTDFGVGWDEVETVGPGLANNLGRQGVTLPSAGVELLFNPTKYFSGSISWGHGFNRKEAPTGNGLQSHGVEISVTATALP